MACIQRAKTILSIAFEERKYEKKNVDKEIKGEKERQMNTQRSEHKTKPNIKAENQEREEREEQKNTRKRMTVIWLERQTQQCCFVYCNKDNAVMYSLVCGQCMYASQTTHERNACIMYINC